MNEKRNAESHGRVARVIVGARLPAPLRITIRVLYTRAQTKYAVGIV